MGVQEWCDSVSQEFRALAAALNIVPDHRFIRTTSPEHRRTVLSFWVSCETCFALFLYSLTYLTTYLLYFTLLYSTLLYSP